MATSANKVTIGLGGIRNVTQKMKSGERQLKALTSSLTKIVGAENVPLGTVGDLSMLLDALRRAVNSLTGLMEFRRSFERRPATKLHELEMELEFVRELLKDLRPSLRKMTKTAYRACEDHDDERKALGRVDRMLKKVEALQLKPEEREG